jgi:membrane protein DedA with SNARE-associated domain
MSLFNSYVHPLTVWLHENPHWALFMTFIISFAESLAIIGSIVPGSVTMTAIGILAGSGVMRIDLTLLAAILGAVAGDSGSYMLGYYYRDQLVNIWPFKRYPHWLKLGTEYFEQHGGKSVLIGRFIGPLRSIIPLIAGMMHMNQWRFFLANFISAIGWSIIYVVPGILIGAASNELSSENATRLFIYILLILLAIWLLSLLIKWLLIKANRILSVNLHAFWLWSKRHPKISSFFLALTPVDEKRHYPTAALVIITLISTMFFLLLTILIANKQYISDTNYAVYYFLQSLREAKVDLFFIYISQLTNLFSLSFLLIIIISHAIYKRNYRFGVFISALFLLTLLISYWLAQLIHFPRPTGLLITDLSSAYPDIRLTVASALLVFLILYKNKLFSSISSKLSNISLAVILLLSGIAPLYLGDAWLISVLASWLMGLTIALYFWIGYRRRIKPQKRCHFPILSESIILAILATILFSFSYQEEIHQHQPYYKQYIISEMLWWNQKNQILPKYRKNRIGKIRSVFNIQYSGRIDSFKAALEKSGWQVPNSNFLTNLLEQLSTDTREMALPLFAQLHNNKRSVLLMTYPIKACNCQLVLRLWLSNYHINRIENPLWIGSVHVNHPIKFFKNKKEMMQKIPSPLGLLKQALSEFDSRVLTINTKEYKYSDAKWNFLLLVKD